MVMQKRCEKCKERFDVAVFNPHHHRFCRKCAADQRREKQRKTYQRKYQDDHVFREREQKRACAGNRRRRLTAKVAVPIVAAPATPPPSSISLAHVLLGILAQLLDTTDPLHLAQMVGKYADRGRQLAVLAEIWAVPTG